MLISSTARLKSAPRISTQNNGQRRCDWIMEGSYKVGNRDEFFPINAAVVGQYAEYWLNRLSAGVVIYFWGDLRTEAVGETERFVILVSELKVVWRPKASETATATPAPAPKVQSEAAPAARPASASVLPSTSRFLDRQEEKAPAPKQSAPSDGLKGPESWDDANGDFDF